uniref:Progestin and adipoQ receptor family member 3 n=1 Tax=Canis lupus familiaris TaxID=9615 RepID=A0A8P0NB02_CANLF
MHQKLLKSAHYIELGSYQYWPVLVPRGIRLYTYEQIPVSLKDNPYITDGYRAYLPSRLCIKSLFILSNETVNIWSHLLGFFLFFTLGIYDMTSVLPSASASREDFVICSICLFCFQVCMLCSVGYHLFSCHRSEKTCRRWMALDYAGISIGILGCYVSGVFYAFYLLAPSVLDHSACYDPSGVLCTDPSQLPHTAVAEAPFYHLLFCVRIWSDPHSSLGLAQWRNRCSYCTGLCTPCNCDVCDCSSCFPILHFQSS